MKIWYSKSTRGDSMSESELNIIENETLREQVTEQLETVIDPELGIDIVNIGLVYDVILYEGNICEVRITLTTMGCPFAEVIKENIEEAVHRVPDISEVQVKLVWYPSWTPNRLSKYAKIALGIR